MSAEKIAHCDIPTASGEIRATMFSDGDVQLTTYGRHIIITTHLDRNQAMLLAKGLEEVVSAYDATIDKYHEQCDEPPVSEVP